MERNTYKYQLVEGSKWFGLRRNVVYSSITYDFSRRGVEHRRDFPSATIKQVGGKVTREEGLKWLKKQNKTSYARIAHTI